VLDSADFYAGCRHLLTEDGVMTVNLFGRHASFEQSVQTIADVFGQASVWVFKPTREGNAVVVALRTPQSVKRNELMRRAQEIESRWSLPASKWLRVFKPLVM
jgi:spermidine synthase